MATKETTPFLDSKDVLGNKKADDSHHHLDISENGGDGHSGSYQHGSGHDDHHGDDHHGDDHHHGHSLDWSSSLRLALKTLPMIYAKIGITPLFAFSAIFEKGNAPKPTPDDVLGALSHVFYAIIVVFCVKYTYFVLKAHHHEEGGALVLLLNIPKKAVSHRFFTFLTVLTILSVSFYIADGALVPPVSILKAVKGMAIVHPNLEPYKIAISTTLIILVFAIQAKGTQRFAKLFTPIMLVWFVAIFALGLNNIVTYGSGVFKALNPYYIYHFWTQGNFKSMNALGALSGVAWSIYGSEAVFTDMGHFGKFPVLFAWYALVMPAVIVQYAGQASFLIWKMKNIRPDADPDHLTLVIQDLFFESAPESIFEPLTILAALTTFAASVGIIGAIFYLVSQASSMDLFPRVLVLPTGTHSPGQVYIPELNWTLCAVSVGLILIFKKSEPMTEVYGIALGFVFLCTTILYSSVARYNWGWNGVKTGAFLLFFGSIDLLFIVGSSTRLRSFATATVVAVSFFFGIVMTVWHFGRHYHESAIQADHEKAEPGLPRTVESVVDKLRSGKLGRLSNGVGIFMLRRGEIVPSALQRMTQRVGSLPRYSVLVSVIFEEIPFVSLEERFTLHIIDGTVGIFLVELRYGFAEPLSDVNIAADLFETGKRNPDKAPFLADWILSDPGHITTSSGAVVTFYIGTFRYGPAKHYADWNPVGWFYYLFVQFFDTLEVLGRHPAKYYGLPPHNTVDVTTVLYI